MKAMILAAGLGTRLFPLTIDRTKPAIPFLGMPVIGYVARYLASHGVKEAVVNLHHQAQSVRDALGDGSDFGLKITFVEERPEILGTSGALDNARNLLEDGPFIVVNGKIVTNIDLAAAIEHHRVSGRIATMVLKENERLEKFTEVLTEGDRLLGFGGMPSPDREDQAPPYMFTGIQILQPEVFEYIPRGGYSDIIPAFYRPALAKGEPINVFKTTGEWRELSTTRRYLDISLAMSRDTDVIAGRDVRIDPTAKVANSILWEGATISAGASLHRVIVGAGVSIPERAELSDVAVVRADLVRSVVDAPEKAAKGEFIGENYIVPLT